jgi:hypothetical protein
MELHAGGLSWPEGIGQRDRRITQARRQINPVGFFYAGNKPQSQQQGK